MDPDDTDEPKVAKRLGRPPGSRNKAKPGDPERVDPAKAAAFDDYKYADPATLVARNFALIDWTQQALRNEMKRGMASKGKFVMPEDVKKLVEVSNALSRTVEAMKRTSDLAEELSKRMTPEQLLEAALKKLEAQDMPTISYAIKRLKACREKLAPQTPTSKVMPTEMRAIDALVALESE